MTYLRSIFYFEFKFVFKLGGDAPLPTYHQNIREICQKMIIAQIWRRIRICHQELSHFHQVSTPKLFENFFVSKKSWCMKEFLKFQKLKNLSWRLLFTHLFMQSSNSLFKFSVDALLLKYTLKCWWNSLKNDSNWTFTSNSDLSRKLSHFHQVSTPKLSEHFSLPSPSPSEKHDV